MDLQWLALHRCAGGHIMGYGNHQPQKLGVPPWQSAIPSPGASSHPPLLRLAPWAAIASSALENSAGVARIHPQQRPGYGRAAERSREGLDLCSGRAIPPQQAQPERGNIVLCSPWAPQGEQSLRQASASLAHAPQHIRGCSWKPSPGNINENGFVFLPREAMASNQRHLGHLPQTGATTAWSQIPP